MSGLIKRFVLLGSFLSLLIWAVTNISSTVSSPADGRSLNAGMLVADKYDLDKNAPKGIKPHLESIQNGNIPLFQEWLLSPYYGDALNYMNMSLGNESYPPYSLRPLYPLVVSYLGKAINKIWSLDLSESGLIKLHSVIFMLLNVLCYILSIFIGAKILVFFNIRPLPSFVISFVSLLQLGYLKTIYSPMVDQPAVLLSLLLILMILYNRCWWAMLIGGIAVFVKDAMIIYSLFFLIFFLFVREKKLLVGILVMLFAFVCLRVFEGADPLSVQYGWKLSKGDFRLDYAINHFGSLGGILNWCFGIWYSFGLSVFFAFILIWPLGCLVDVERRILLALIAISVVFVLAQIFLASQVARTLTPASVPMVLLTFGFLFKYYGTMTSEALDDILFRR